MATTTKTIEYGFQTDSATLAATVRRDLTAVTVYIPEASPTFVNVSVEVTVADDLAAASSLTSWLIGIKLGAVAFDDVTVTTTVTNSGEVQSYTFTRDVTSYFTTNWTGTSMACQVGLAFGANATQNHSARLRITYTHDDQATTQIKTIRIPIESTRGLLTTSWQTVGGATALPAVGGAYLPEDSPVVRQSFIELWGNESTGDTTDFVAQLRVNGGAAFTWWDSESALISCRFARGIYDSTSEDLSAARSLEAQTVGVTNRMGAVGGWLVVTYEYDHEASSRLFYSMIVAATRERTISGATTVADSNLHRATVWIEEQGTITEKESAVYMFGNISANTSIGMIVGGQTGPAHSYNWVVTGGLSCGSHSFCHRIDANSVNLASGWGTPARGRNEIDIEYFSSVTASGAPSGYLVFNYVADKPASGVGNHSVYKLCAATAVAANPKTTSAVAAAAIAESAFFVQDVMFEWVGQNGVQYPIFVICDRQTGEGLPAADGWVGIAGHITYAAFESGVMRLYGGNSRDFPLWRRWTGDAASWRLDPEATRAWREASLNTFWGGFGFWTTYHTLTTTIAGTLPGVGAGGTAILHRGNNGNADDGEPLMSITTGADGAYSFTWYDDTEDVHVVGESSLGFGVSSQAVVPDTSRQIRPRQIVAR